MEARLEKADPSLRAKFTVLPNDLRNVINYASSDPAVVSQVIVSGARTPSKTGRTDRASPAGGYSARGTVITPTGRSSSAGSRRARVATQRSGDSSRKRSRGQKGRIRTSSSR